MRATRPGTLTVALVLAGSLAPLAVGYVSRRPAGVHREPGSNPLRTALREIRGFASLRRGALWRPTRRPRLV